MIWESDGHTSPNYNSRASMYGVSGIPHVQFNGTEESIGGGTNMYPYYLAIYNQLINDESPIEIGLIGYLNGDNGVDLVADVILTEDVQPGNNKIIYILTYKYNDEYFCTVEGYHEETFDLSHSDEVGTYEHYFELESNWNIDNVNGLVLIQNMSGNHQIYQSTMTEEFGDPSITITFQHTVDWMTVGLPVITDYSNYYNIFPDAIENTLFSFDDGYNLETNLENGEGYWIRFEEPGYTVFEGFALEEITIQLEEGWNLISGISYSVLTNTIMDPYELIVPNTIYSFGEGYELVDELEPGMGYWVRSTGNGDIMILADGVSNVSRIADMSSKLNSISINNKVLYFGGDLPDEVLLSYSLPPLPPEGSLDVRYNDNMRYSRGGGIITLSGLDKLNISYDIQNDEEWSLVIEDKEYCLKEEGDIKFDGKTKSINLMRRMLR